MICPPSWGSTTICWQTNEFLLVYIIVTLSSSHRMIKSRNLPL